MHKLQPKHIKLKSDEVKKILDKYNISVAQLPKISADDPAVPDGSVQGDVLKIERVVEGKTREYFRTVL